MPRPLVVLLEDARESLKNEPGCLRFDVLQDEEDENHFHPYEVYRDPAEFDAHLRTPHFLKYRDATTAVFSEPTLRTNNRNVYPPDDAWQ